MPKVGPSEQNVLTLSLHDQDFLIAVGQLYLDEHLVFLKSRGNPTLVPKFFIAVDVLTEPGCDYLGIMSTKSTVFPDWVMRRHCLTRGRCSFHLSFIATQTRPIRRHKTLDGMKYVFLSCDFERICIRQSCSID